MGLLDQPTKPEGEGLGSNPYQLPSQRKSRAMSPKVVIPAMLVLLLAGGLYMWRIQSRMEPRVIHLHRTPSNVAQPNQ